MKIKTFLMNTDRVELFDEAVNAALDDGWHLVKREILPGMNYNADNWARRALYAELVEPDPPQEEPAPAVLTAARIIKDHCNSCQSCRDCLLDDICDLSSPDRWTFPHREAPEA